MQGSAKDHRTRIARDIKPLVLSGKRYQANTCVTVGNLAAGTGLAKFQTVHRCNGSTTASYPWLAGVTLTALR